MKVYDTKEKEMILEPSFKFAGNPNIIVAVKAFGMKATVQVMGAKLGGLTVQSGPLYKKLAMKLAW
jgi:hypothetical protein